jgi:hypothetical protein
MSVEPTLSRSFESAVALLVLAGWLALPGCAWTVARATRGVAENLSAATLNHPDPETVRQGAPAFLLAMDGLIAGDPDNPSLLIAGSRLYGAYVSAFVAEPERAMTLSDRSLGYAHRALCTRDRQLCEATSRPFGEFAARLAKARASDIEALYSFSLAWAVWIQTHSSDWNAIAELPKVEAAFERVLSFEEPYDSGNAHLYLGVLYTQRPASMGGKPEVGREHFERAIALSEGRNLLAKVLFAKQYARLVFDRALHDRLLEEVLAADPEAAGLTLSNVLAQQQARILLADSSDFF